VQVNFIWQVLASSLAFGHGLLLISLSFPYEATLTLPAGIAFFPLSRGNSDLTGRPNGIIFSYLSLSLLAWSKQEKQAEIPIERKLVVRFISITF